MDDIIIKIAETLEMSFEIPVSEKKKAQIIVNNLRKIIETLESCSKYLNNIYTPFKNATDLSEEDILKYRGALYRFKNEIKEKYNNLKQQTFTIIMQLEYFEDLTVKEFISSIKSEMKDIEDQVEPLMEILDDPNVPDFKNTIVSSIESIFKESLQFKQLLEERIISHINDNILGDDWFRRIQEQTNKLNQHLSPVVELYKQRQKIIEDNKG